jgi:hypothetical protein
VTLALTKSRAVSAAVGGGSMTMNVLTIDVEGWYHRWCRWRSGGRARTGSWIRATDPGYRRRSRRARDVLRSRHGPPAPDLVREMAQRGHSGHARFPTSSSTARRARSSKRTSRARRRCAELSATPWWHTRPALHRARNALGARRAGGTGPALRLQHLPRS